MLDFNALHLNALIGAIWDSTSWKKCVTPTELEWLSDSDSMTKRLESHCETLTVEVIGIYEAQVSALSESERHFLSDEGGLVREVVLHGNNQPWICARTLMPNSTLTGQEQDIALLGSIPLGQRVFKEGNIRRDAIEVARVELAGCHLLARRSRLWVNNKRLLVCELFLPQAPIYQKER